MLLPQHIEITRHAIGADVSARALQFILRANAGQDNLCYQFGHDHFHFDNNQLQRSNAYIEEQRALVCAALTHDDARSAWQAFGRMLHTVQDFYAHSDYIPRWLSRFNGQTLPPPPEVDPVCLEILQHPGLHSGKLYYPLEILAFLPPLRKYILPLLPADSHAHMNHDGPRTSAQFDYVFHASIKRTKLEFEQIAAQLSPGHLSLFTDRQG